MKNTIKINDCVEFKNELHKRLYEKSGAKDFNEYIKYISSNYSFNKATTKSNKHIRYQ
ncbi:MAG: hypothetical protein LBC73_08535 [Oscillospiraceae bacterium]|jgi:hypothetical protein|nr:hypothetical protein [Oscillospiraceae bacterium]